MGFFTCFSDSLDVSDVPFKVIDVVRIVFVVGELVFELLGEWDGAFEVDSDDEASVLETLKADMVSSLSFLLWDFLELLSAASDLSLKPEIRFLRYSVKTGVLTR